MTYQDMKILINGAEVEVKEKKVFEYEGLSFGVHRPYKSITGWVVSEFTTGLRVGGVGATMDKAILSAKGQLDNAKDMGFNVIEHAQKVLRETRPQR